MSSPHGFAGVERVARAPAEVSGTDLQYQPALDGLRGLAVAAVLAFHAELGWLPGGFLGVSTFLTLSGFLITTLLLRERPGRQVLRRFWARRVRRLMPASMLTLGGVVAFGAVVATPSQLADLRLDVLAALANVANWRFILADQSYVDLFGAPSPVLHFWSLAIEEQFYLLYPLILMGLLRITARSRRWLICILMGAAGLSSAWMATLCQPGESIDRAYYGTDTRASELLIGAVLAVMLLDRPVIPRAGIRRYVGWAASAALVVLLALYATTRLEDAWLYRGGFLVVSLLGALTILGAMQPGTPVARILGLPPLRALGLISYAVYLFHWPIYLALEQSLDIRGLPLLVVGSAMAILLASASYHLLERPVRQRRMLTGKARILAIPAAALSVITLTLVVTEDPPEDPLALLAQAEAGAMEPAPPEPEPGVDRPLRLLVVGDSLAEPLAGGLGRLEGGTFRMDVSSLTGQGCERSLTDATGGSEPCAAWASGWKDRAVELDPDVVLLTLGATSAEEIAAGMGAERPAGDAPFHDAWLRQALGDLIDDLSEGGASMIVAEFPHPLRVDHQPDLPEPILATAEALRSAALADSAVTFVPADELPTYPEPSAGSPGQEMREWSDATASALLGSIRDAAAKSDASKTPRVMVVGDSVGWFIGHGLERWGLRTGSLRAWNTATAGCGIARGGDLLLYQGTEPSRAECDDWAQRWSRQLEEFDPDLVVVLTGLWDFTDRRLSDSESFHHIGEAGFDRWLLDEYEDAIDVLSTSGAEVVWLTFPCHSGRILPGPLAENPALETDRLAHYNQVLVPALAERQPQLRVLDLFARVCPDGSFTQHLGGYDDARPDGVHFRAEVAFWIAEWMGPQLLDP